MRGPPAMTRRFILPALALAGLATAGLAAPALGSATAKAKHGDWVGSVKGSHGTASVEFAVDKAGSHVKKLYADAAFPRNCYWWGDNSSTAFVKKARINHSRKFSAASSPKLLQKGVSIH